MSFSPEAPMVWAEIPVSDMKRAMTFYSDVFGYDLTETPMGPNPTAIIPNKDMMGIGLHLYPGKPAAEGQRPTIHLVVADKLEEAMERVTKAGGTVLPMPPTSIPPGRFAYTQDPDGNSIGLFEPVS